MSQPHRALGIVMLAAEDRFLAAYPRALQDRGAPEQQGDT